MLRCYMLDTGCLTLDTRYWTPRVLQVPALQLRPVHPRTAQVPAAGHRVQAGEAGRHVLHLCSGVTTFIVT